MTDGASTIRPQRISFIQRRRVLQAGALGGVGLAAAALIGCEGDDDDTPSPTQQATQGTGTSSPTSALVEEYTALAEADGAPYPYTYAEPDKTPKRGGTIVLGVTWEPAVFDPNKSAGADAVNLATMVGDRLVGVVTGPEMSKYDIEFQPELAKSWELAPDGLTYTFHLQDNVKFQNLAPVNGRPFVAKDVVETYERARNSVTNKPFFSLVDTVTAPDAKTVRITMKKPDADFLIPLSSKALPIYPSEIYDQKLIDNNQLIGTGPAMLDEWEQGSFIRVKANPDYWQGAPLLDGFEWRSIKDAAARVAAFRAGQIDAGHGLASAPQEIEALRKTNPDIQLCSDPILASSVLMGVNPNHPKFKDVRIRQAMSLALDRDKLTALLAFGQGKVLPEFGWPFLFDKTPTDAELGPWYKYDLAQAKQLLAAAGVDQLEFELISASSYMGAAAEPLYAAFGDMWKAIGITMKVKPADFSAFNAQYYGLKFVTDVGEGIQGFSTQAPSANGYFYDAMHSTSAKNYFGVNDQKIDEWADKQRSEVDPEVRKETQRAIFDYFLKDGISRFASATGFSTTILGPAIRYYRFNGPYIGIHWFYDWGQGFHKAWLDK